MEVDLSLATIMTANFSTSQEADSLSQQMKSRLGLSTNYQIARLALGRSLSIKQFPDAPNSKSSKSIEGHLLFGKEEEFSLLWIGLIITHFKCYGKPTQIDNAPKIDLSVFQELVHKHWHRGIKRLDDDWKAAKSDYERFIQLLTTRRLKEPAQQSLGINPVFEERETFELGLEAQIEEDVKTRYESINDDLFVKTTDSCHDSAVCLAKNPVFLDTETTGFSKLDQIVEIAIIDHDGTVLMDTLIKPTVPISYRAIQVHGINEHKVKKAPSFADIWPTLLEILNNRPVVIYNQSFDLRMIRQSLKAHGITAMEPPLVYCAMEMYTAFRGKAKLEVAAEQCGIPVPSNRHRAAADAELMRQLVMYMANFSYKD
jgi:DNA polymerase III subunit epsilon